MILVASPSKPLACNTKGAPKRATILQDYHSEINNIYAALEHSNNVDPPSDWSPKNLYEFVTRVINGTLKNPVKDTEDIFNHGCDRWLAFFWSCVNPPNLFYKPSLQATWIRNSILQVLRDVPSVSIGNISPNFVYEHPSITSLAKYVCDVVSDLSAAPSHSADALKTMLARYTKPFPKHVPGSPSTGKDVVLVTGTTGALGSAVLAKLASSTAVGKIFAFNRPSRQSGIMERQKRALRSRGYDENISVLSKVTLVEGDLSAASLGVDAALEAEVNPETFGTTTSLMFRRADTEDDNAHNTRR